MLDYLTKFISAEMLEELEQRCMLNGYCESISVQTETELVRAIDKFIKEAKGE